MIRRILAWWSGPVSFPVTLPDGGVLDVSVCGGTRGDVYTIRITVPSFRGGPSVRVLQAVQVTRRWWDSNRTIAWKIAFALRKVRR